MDFGEKIKELREAKGMTQQNLADLLFVTRQTVSRWEGGSRYPDLVTAKNLADILDTTIDTLLADDGKMSSEQIAKSYGKLSGKIETMVLALSVMMRASTDFDAVFFGSVVTQFSSRCLSSDITLCRSAK